MTLLVSPLMSAWMRKRIATRATLLLPSDAPFVTEQGPDPDRVALIGSGAAAGIGVRSHALALPGTVARALSLRTGRGATVEAFARPGCSIDDVLGLVEDARLSRYDAIVVLVGLEDAIAMRTPQAWRRSVTTVLDALQKAAARDTAVLMLGVPQVSAIGVYTGARARVADRQAGLLNRVMESIADVRQGVLYGPLSVPEGTGREASSAWYDVWGPDIAEALAPVLAPPTKRPVGARGIRDVPEVEADRIAALEKTGLAHGDGDSRFDRVTALAHEVLGGDAASVGFLDQDTLWFSSIVGLTAASVPRWMSICNRTIQQDGPSVVGDLRLDRSFEGNPVVWGEPGMRFYAGCPIESADGYRIGAICVFGREPRDPSTVDLVALQRLATMARNEVWEAGRTDSTPAPAGFPAEPIRAS